MNKPLISIVVPVYNAVSSLPKMLDTIINQTYTEWELILVNDGSKDKSEKVIKNYLKKDKRIQYFSHENAGPSAARNLGISKVQGRYLTFIDADDWVEPSYLEKLLIAMEAHSVDIVCGGYYEVNKKHPKGLKLHDFSAIYQNKILQKEEYQANLFNGVSGVLWSKLFKTEIFEINQIRLNPEIHLSEDLLIVLEYSTHVRQVYIISDSIYFYNRLNETGLSRKMSLSNYKDLERVNNEIVKYMDELPFLNLEQIIEQRRCSFSMKFLKDNSYSIQKFYKSADFINKKIEKHDVDVLTFNKENRMILNLAFSKKYFLAWSIINIYAILRKFKNGFK